VLRCIRNGQLEKLSEEIAERTAHQRTNELPVPPTEANPPAESPSVNSPRSKRRLHTRPAPHRCGRSQRRSQTWLGSRAHKIAREPRACRPPEPCARPCPGCACRRSLTYTRLNPKVAGRVQSSPRSTAVARPCGCLPRSRQRPSSRGRIAVRGRVHVRWRVMSTDGDAPLPRTFFSKKGSPRFIQSSSRRQCKPHYRSHQRHQFLHAVATDF
jgi:hypothetical protein